MLAIPHLQEFLFTQAFKDRDQVFDKLLKNFEDEAAQVRLTSNAPTSSLPS